MCKQSLVPPNMGLAVGERTNLSITYTLSPQAPCFLPHCSPRMLPLSSRHCSQQKSPHRRRNRRAGVSKEAGPAIALGLGSCGASCSSDPRDGWPGGCGGDNRCRRVSRCGEASRAVPVVAFGSTLLSRAVMVVLVVACSWRGPGLSLRGRRSGLGHAGGTMPVIIVRLARPGTRRCHGIDGSGRRSVTVP